MQLTHKSLKAPGLVSTLEPEMSSPDFQILLFQNRQLVPLRGGAHIAPLARLPHAGDRHASLAQHLLAAVGHARDWQALPGAAHGGAVYKLNAVGPIA